MSELPECAQAWFPDGITVATAPSQRVAMMPLVACYGLPIAEIEPPPNVGPADFAPDWPSPRPELAPTRRPAAPFRSRLRRRR